jgi:cellulose synthase (UDP-forming)
VKVSRRCEFEIDGRWVPASIDDVSVNGARLTVNSSSAGSLAKDGISQIRFKPYWGSERMQLPVSVRNLAQDGSTMAIGCLYHPESAEHHRLVADLIFANSRQWTQFQESRRGNPGLLRGTVWFLGLSIYETYRGLVYFGRTMRSGNAEIQGAPVKAGKS